MSADVLVDLYNDLDWDKIRVSRPSKIVFLCGGVIQGSPSEKPTSLRDFLFRTQAIQKKLSGQIVLAEKANQLYRETSYGDLISFEEDIARIAAVVLVIAESPGALAELGAFATNNTISRALRIIMHEKYASAESFIRFGPVERIKNKDRNFVGFYPWKTNKRGQIVISSAKPHFKHIVDFINNHIASVPNSVLLRNLEDARKFYIIYWTIYVTFAVSQTVLHSYLDRLSVKIANHDLKNCLYCMELAGWIAKAPYSGKDYYFAISDEDPFDYAFKGGVVQKDSIRRKADLTRALKAIEEAPRHVRNIVVERRRAGR